ncbi:uncharacterized protein [Dermacentor albipictus]|uniref:uncharacterized protein isoform X4 n=1 Tax=Dermacentor albipictus TaxID=60249 RepID=UPI0038FCF506
MKAPARPHCRCTVRPSVKVRPPQELAGFDSQTWSKLRGGTLHIEVSSVSTLARFLSKRLIASQLEERQQRLGHGETARVSRERKRPSPVQREVTAWLLTFSAQEIFSATWLFPLSAVLLPLAATFLRVQLASAHKVGPCSALTMRA